MSAYTKVPMDRLAPLIERWLAANESTAKQLSELSGVSARRLYVIRRGYDATTRKGRQYRHDHVEFDTADRLLTAMDYQAEWYDSLKDIAERDDNGS